MTTPLPALAAILAAMILACAPAARAELAAPTGPVVLTVVGAIAHANRGPMDPAVDKLMAYHEQTFEAGAAFDRAMLEALGMETRRLTLDSLPDEQTLEGPTLRRVLEAVGAAPARVTILALDGFATELDAKALAAHDWLLALNRNGHPLGLGDYGPAWLVFSPAAANGVATKDEAQLWPYQAFLIRVEGE